MNAHSDWSPRFRSGKPRNTTLWFGYLSPSHSHHMVHAISHSNNIHPKIHTECVWARGRAIKSLPRVSFFTSECCYCSRVRWQPVIRLAKRSLMCCIQDFSPSRLLHQVPLSLISFPQHLSFSHNIRSQTNLAHIRQSNHFHNVSVSVSETGGKRLPGDLWNAMDCWEEIISLLAVNAKRKEAQKLQLTFPFSLLLFLERPWGAAVCNNSSASALPHWNEDVDNSLSHRRPLTCVRLKHRDCLGFLVRRSSRGFQQEAESEDRKTPRSLKFMKSGAGEVTASWRNNGGIHRRKSHQATK